MEDTEHCISNFETFVDLLLPGLEPLLYVVAPVLKFEDPFLEVGAVVLTS